MWRDYEIHHRDPDRTRLLLDAVGPVAAALRPHVDSLYFLPHWLHGSHVRLCVAADPDVHRDLVRPTVERMVRPWLDAHEFASGTGGTDEAELLAAHRRLAELEHETGPLLPIEADGAIVERAHDDRRTVLGGEPAARLLADFYSGTDTFALDLVERTPAAGGRLLLAFELMIATAHRSSGIGLQRGFVSFRSHAEAFLSWWPEAQGLRDRWDRHFAAHADDLIARMDDVIGRVDAASGDDLAWRWPRLLQPYLDRGTAMLRSGEMSMDPPWAGRTSLDDDEVARLAAASPWHNSPRPSTEPVDELWFGRYRLALNYTYLQLTRIGLQPVERFLLCHLAANAVERHWGVAAEDVVLPTATEPAGSPL